MTRRTRTAVDVGGTFTDVVRWDPSGALVFDKVPTTPATPTRGVIDAFGKAGADIADVSIFTHGTTLGLNALLTRSGARVAVIATRGFRDVYLLGRTDRRVNYDITYRKPAPLLERADTFEVTERSTFDGAVHTAFDADDARAVAERIRDGGYDAVAVAFLHAYANPEHELAMRAVLREVVPGVDVSLSHDLSREYREYERTSTAVLDAYIKPIVRRYLDRLDSELADRGFGGQFLMTRSAGGAMTASAAMDQPVGLVLSGPAGGVIGAAELSGLIDEPNLITIDMGGTSLDASLVIDGEPVLYQGAEFEQLPINMPSLYIHTIGAGGGSLVRLDEAGALHVGPASAGAVPGPASYGNGGTEPTFTDAALTVGYLGADAPLGGTLTLDADLARTALGTVADRLGISHEELARGVLRISTATIVGAVRAITVDLGRDPRDFALLSFGGGGGLVAVDVARELGVPRVVVPPGQGAFSAFGMLMADVQHDYARTTIVLLEDLDPGAADAVFDELADAAHAALDSEGFPADRRRLTRSVDVRYVGQEHSVTIPFPDGEQDYVKVITDRFADLHVSQYGHAMPDPVQVTTFRTRAVGTVDKPSLPRAPRREGPPPEPHGRRPVYVDGERPAVDYALYDREDLRAGDVVAGPAVVAEHTATTVLHAADVLRVGSYGEMVISLEEGPQS